MAKIKGSQLYLYEGASKSYQKISRRVGDFNALAFGLEIEPICLEPTQNTLNELRQILPGVGKLDGVEVALKRAGRPLAAIRAHRDRTGLGLREAKQVVDETAV